MKTGPIKNLSQKLSYLVHTPAAWVPIVSWPVFSLTSFAMISDLVKQGVVPRTVIDVGANIGQFAVASANLFPHVIVHSFEPNPDCVAQLKDHVRSLNNILINPFALGDMGGQTSFHVNSHSHSSSILRLAEKHQDAFPHAREMCAIQVEVSTLDTVFANVDLNPPILLKLDVQGYESKVLQGGSDFLKRVDYVVLEASFKPMYVGEMLFMEIAHLMERYGFIFLRPVSWLPDPYTGEIIQMDALFQRKRA